METGNSKLFCLFLFVFWSTPVLAWENSPKEEEVVFFNGKLRLAGTLFIPSSGKNFAAIAVTHGSGKEHRKQEGYRSLAMFLANEGYVVLIFDKRGVGDSQGRYVETPEMSVPAGDLIEAVKFLKGRKEVNGEKIGVYGHSQGGWVAPLAASICKDISFVMVSCGGGVSPREQILYSFNATLRGRGYAPASVDSIIVFGRHLYTYIATGVGYAAVNELYEQSSKKKWFEFFTNMGFSRRLPPPSMLKEPVFNYFKAISYDPQSTLRSLEIPVLVILAGKDESIPAEKSKQLWEEAFYANGHADLLDVISLPNENHYDFEITNGVIQYKRTFIELMLEWLIKLRR